MTFFRHILLMGALIFFSFQVILAGEADLDYENLTSGKAVYEAELAEAKAAIDTARAAFNVGQAFNHAAVQGIIESYRLARDLAKNAVERMWKAAYHALTNGKFGELAGILSSGKD